MLLLLSSFILLNLWANMPLWRILMHKMVKLLSLIIVVVVWFYFDFSYNYLAITTDKKSISLLRYAWTFLSILSTETRWSSKPKHCVKYFNNTASDPAHKKLHSLSYWNYMFLVVILFLYQRHLLVYKNIDILGYLTHQVHYIWNEHYEEWCFFYNYTTFIKLKWIGI